MKLTIEIQECADGVATAITGGGDCTPAELAVAERIVAAVHGAMMQQQPGFKPATAKGGSLVQPIRRGNG